MNQLKISSITTAVASIRTELKPGLASTGLRSAMDALRGICMAGSY